MRGDRIQLDKMKQNINKLVYCCGCGGCETVCPVKCISLLQDANGFWRAFCEEKWCVHCGKCLKVCPFVQKKEKLGEIPLHVYAAVSKNEEFYRRSASGGMFSQLAEWVIEMHHGTVWGCMLDEKLKAVHRYVESMEELDKLRRSKYVQSDTRGVFAIVKQQLEAGRHVLFVGTPCQVNGVRRYLGREYNNFFAVDILCHGVPSPGIFERHIQYLQKKHHGMLTGFEFRQKRYQNEKTYHVTYLLGKAREKYLPFYRDAYYNAFYHLESLAESCYVCPYASERRCGDITLGDYAWAKKWHPEFSAYEEISCVLINTEKGLQLFETVAPGLICRPTRLEYVMMNNEALCRPTKRPAYRDKIDQEMRNCYARWAGHYFHSLRYIRQWRIWLPLKWIKQALKKCKSKF